MTLHVVYDSTDLATSDHVRLPSVQVSINAEEGSGAHSQLNIEDVGGALDIVGLRRVWLWESAETAGNEVLGTWYVADRQIGRDVGPLEEQVVSSDRWWQVGLVDHNVLLNHRVVTGADGDRPAETDIARINWLIGSPYLATVGNSLGYINTTGAVNLDKADLRGQKAYDVLQECANHSNKNFHLVPVSPTTSAGATSYSLWYDFDYSASYRSTLRLTNDGTEDNSTTFAVDPDMVLRRTPERVYSGVLVRFNGGEVYVQNTATGNAFAFRDAVHHAVNLTSTSTATVRANRYLADADTEEDRITCRFTVPKEKVNQLREGQACEVKFSHLPGYTSYTWVRCLERTVRQLSDEFYEIQVELATSVGGAAAATATQANLMRGNDDLYQGSGLYNIEWQNDGDAPQAGDDSNAIPLLGLIEYVGDQPNRTALRVLGDGVVTITFCIDFVVVTTPPITLGIRILVNGATVASYTEDKVGGLGAYALDNEASPLVASNVTVRDGDVITAQAYNSQGITMVIPQGAGNKLHQLRVVGTLA